MSIQLSVRLCIRLLLICLTLTAVSLPAAQANERRLDRLEHFSSQEGLSGNWVRVIRQDRQGFLWLGTINGLNRFDGYTFKSFRHDPDDPRSLSDNSVTSMHVSRSGDLWIGTTRGLNRLDGDGFTRYRHDPQQNDRLGHDSLSHDYVTGIYEDRLGFLWISTHHGVDRLNLGTGAFTHFVHDANDSGSLSDNTVTSLQASRSGTLWFGTSDGILHQFDRQGGRFLRHHLFDEDPETATTGGIWRMAEDAAGRLWIGTDRGDLAAFDPETQRHELYRLSASGIGYITALYPRDDDKLWVGTDRNGVLILDPETGAFSIHQHDPTEPGSLSSNQVSAISEDRTGVIWLGTNGGLDKYSPLREQFALYRHRPSDPNSLSANFVSSVIEDRTGRFWVGTETNGLNQWDRQNGVFTHYRHTPDDPNSLSGNEILSLFEDSEGDLWIGSDGGVDRFDAERCCFRRLEPDIVNSARPIEGPIYALAESEPGVLWIGGAGGLHRFDKPTKRLQTLDATGIVIALRVDSKGFLWLGTYGKGLARFDPTREVFTSYLYDSRDPSSLSSDFVVSLWIDHSGALWVGTIGGGLNRFDPERESFTRYREKDGLSNDSVVEILEDSTGHLWLATLSGLNRFDPRDETYDAYDVEDGLQSHVFSNGAAWRSANGEMFFGGAAGLNAFFPETLRRDSQPPQVAITSFLLLNRPVSFAERQATNRGKEQVDGSLHLTLTHEDDVFAFEFTAFHFVKPTKNRFAYTLEGFNTEWIETGADNRVAQYTNLDAGEYVFRVKAANADNVWSEDSASLRLTVLPPPWKTSWAYALYSLTSVAIALGTVRWQQQRIERERAVSRQLREVDQLKDEFLANTSHELRTPLYGITGLAESLVDGAHGDLPEAAKADLSMVVTSARRLSHLVNDILDFSKLRHKGLEFDRQTVDLKPLVEIVLTLSRPLVGTKTLELVNTVPADGPAALADENRLQQILHNLVGNAVKFTESGSIRIGAELVESESTGTSGRLVVSVSDTGIGIPEDKQKRIFDAFEQVDASIERQFGGSGLGLAVTRQLIERGCGEIWLESTPGSGSTFSFSLPCAAESSASEEVSAIDGMAKDIMANDDTPTPSVTVSAAVTNDPLPVTSLASARKTAPDAARILVVDDEPINRQVLRNFLSVESFDLTLASSGDEALRLLREQTFDLVLLDIMMPKISGYEVCRSLRQQHPIGELPVIFLTAKNLDSDVVTGIDLGANDYLTKPISKECLLARIRPHLELSRIHRNLENLVEEKISQVKILQGLLPICCSCKKIRDDKGYWSELEHFIDLNSEAEFSHGICPSCVEDYRRA